jgi:signal transduction histidine kinase
VRIEVSDTGTGIPPGVNVFELFFTTKSKGTGMGLNIVEGIIQQHGGHVDVSSAEGKGTTLTLEIPLGAADVARRSRG